MLKKFKWGFYIAIVVICILGFYFRVEHPHFIWQKIPVYDALFGFIGCLVLIVVAKTSAHYLLQKEEDYYDK